MSLPFIQIHKQIFESILGYLESWADRQNLAFASKAHYNFCLQYRENTPPFTTDQLLRVSCTQFVLTTITSINIHRSDIDKPLQFKILIRLINNAPHLNKIVSNLPGKRVIKSISEALINRLSKTELSVFAFKGDMVKWHRLLDSQIRNKSYNVKIFMIDSEDSSSSSSSSEESDGEEDQAHVTPLKRKITLYETSPEIRSSLKKIKRTMMEPYIDSGRARLKTKEIPVVKFLKTRSFIDEDITYQPGSLFRTLNDSCLFSKPYNNDTTNQYILSSATPFIHSIIYTKKVWVMATQIDVFVRNMKALDPCSLDTYNIPYYSQATARKISKSSGRGNSWFELSIMFQRLELLVTGAIFGEVGSDNVCGYLGPSLTSLEKLLQAELDDNLDILYTPAASNDYKTSESLQQNYARSSSHFLWSIKSMKYVRKDFYAYNPLDLDDKSVACIGSYLLRCICSNSFNQDNMNHLYQKVQDADFITEAMLPVSRDLAFVTRIRRDNIEKFDYIFQVWIDLVEGATIGRSPQSIVSGETATKVYNSIKGKILTINNRAISKKLYLK